ncbi:arylamine N-acetyltransferase [Hydrotalea sp.]|uniref:arylamine N-acetyltransferase n=1 Tax=Hydrotalea sp. TaxID=2881279 RepID=UPI002621F734|nr:arylamine N-acetyltransferase [Hydrotalea sp.]
MQELVIAYCCRIPWESASKIIKQRASNASCNYVRLEKEFWPSVFLYGTGGTCYESNLAFFYLLSDLGFKGYLTINRIIDKSSVHSAIIIVIDNNKYIVDVGYPLYSPITIKENSVVITENKLITYQCTSIDNKQYLIENFPHPKPYLYHLTDLPVTLEEYLKIANNDYGDDGLFSNRIIIRKVINDIPTRFDSEDIPYNIHTLKNGQKVKTFIEEKNLTDRLSNHFGLHNRIISQAFKIIQKTNAQQKQQHYGTT